VPLFAIPRHTLSQLLNLRLRQSDEAAFAVPTDNAKPNTQASISHKILFIVIRRKNIKLFFYAILYSDLNIKIKCFFKNVNIVLIY
jgi:hypothetical protein